MASKLSALKIVESAHISELKKTKDVLWKTKDGLLKTEDILLKIKDGCTFSYGKVKDKDVFLIRTKFHLGMKKGRGKRRYWGESLNEGYFC